jgi:WD40 repeat protein
VSFSPDAALLATASRDQNVRIWDTQTGTGLRALQHNSAVRDAQFSPDGRWIVTAAGRAILWDADTGGLVVRLQGHEGPVTASTFDPSGRVIFTGGVDGTVRMYVCEICGGIDDLMAIAEERLAATGRTLTPEEREQYLG